MVSLGCGASYAQTPAWGDVVKLEASDAAQLERQLAAHPEDLTARGMLMAYYRRADRSHNSEDRSKLARHIQWLIAHRPNSELLRMSPGQSGGEDHARATALWEAAAKAHPRDAAV